LTVF
jgi:hypothetical protein